MIAWSMDISSWICSESGDQGQNSTKDLVFNLQDITIGYQSFFVKKQLLLITIGELYWILVIRMKGYKWQHYMLRWANSTR